MWGGHLAVEGVQGVGEGSFVAPEFPGGVDRGLGVENYQGLSQNGESVFRVPPPPPPQGGQAETSTFRETQE